MRCFKCGKEIPADMTIQYDHETRLACHLYFLRATLKLRQMLMRTLEAEIKALKRAIRLSYVEQAEFERSK